MLCCGLTGAPVNFSIYTGTPSAAMQAQEKEEKKQAKMSGDDAPPARLAQTIINLIPKSFRNSSPTFFPRYLAVDNYYNYFSIHRAVNKLGLGMLGTYAARGRKAKVPNPDSFPFSYSDPQGKALPKGWFRQARHKSNRLGERQLLAVVWKDNKLVKFLSSVNNLRPPDAKTVAKRKTKESKGVRVDVPAHPVSVLYNKYMGGVDLLDQYMAKFPLGYKVRKWYMRVFFWLVNLGVVTCFIYIRVRGGPVWEEMTSSHGGAQLSFRLQLQDQLWRLALKDGNYKKKSDVSRMKRVREVQAAEAEKQTRKERKKKGQDDHVATPARKRKAVVSSHTPGSARKVTRAVSPSNNVTLPSYNPRGGGQAVEKVENRGGHKLVKNVDGKQRRCKMCAAALTPDQKRSFWGNERVNGVRKIVATHAKRTIYHCSFCKCNKMPLCKAHFEEHNKKNDSIHSGTY